MGFGDFLQQVLGGGQQKAATPPILPSRPIPNINAGYEDPYGESSSPAMDAYYDVVSNPPIRRGPSKLRMVGTGLLSALQGSTGPESRVPLYNEKGRVVGSREAGFWESLGNKPFNVAQANQILDMPFEAQVEDWERQAKGLGTAANIEKTAESNAALADYRRAQAAAAPQRAAATQTTADARMLDAKTKERLALLKDVPESKRLEMLQDGRMELAEFQALAAMDRVSAQQAGATERVGMQQTGATERTGMQQEGALERTNIQQSGANTRAEMGGATIGTVPGPDGKPMGVWYNPRTQKLEQIKLGDQPTAITPAKAGQAAGENPQEIARLQGIRSMAEQTTGALQELIDPTTGQLANDVKWAVGGSKYSSIIPGTAAATGAIKIKRAKDLLTLQLIGEMKAQSKTGATGFGAMNLKELGVLESAASKLDPNMREEDFLKEIQRIMPLLNKINQPGQNITVTGTGPSKEDRKRSIINKYLPQ